MKKNIILTAVIVMVLSSCGLQKGGSIRQDFSDFGQNLRMIVSSNGIKAEKNITNKDIASSEYAYVVGGFYGRNEWLHVSKNFDDSWEDDEVVELPLLHNYIFFICLLSDFGATISPELVEYTVVLAVSALDVTKITRSEKTGK